MDVGFVGILITVLTAAGVTIYQYIQKQQLEEERKGLQEEKDEYEKTVENTREIIKDLQRIICGGEEISKSELTDSLDQLESTVLPKNDQIISKLDRIQYKVGEEDN